MTSISPTAQTQYSEVSCQAATKTAAVNNNKYDNISKDNPIRKVVEIESEITGKEKAQNALRIINKIIGITKKKTDPYLSPNPKEALTELYKIIHKDLGIKYKAQIFISDGLSEETPTVDCDTGSFIYVAVAHEMQWPIDIILVPGHAYVIWRHSVRELPEAVVFHFETTNGKFKEDTYIDRNGGIRADDKGSVVLAYKNLALYYAKYKNWSNALKAINKAQLIAPLDENVREIKNMILADMSGKNRKLK